MKKLVFLFSAVFFTTMVFAQTDFSGSWTLNTSKSKLGERSFAPKSVVIVQTKADISIETHSEFQGEERVRKSKYTLDGKECTNKGFRDMDVKSTAVWSADKKALTITSKVSMDNGDMTMKSVYKMDGANLVNESSSSSPMGDRSETQVFDKK
ncbi:MAG TPA: hypothetical protein VLQ91_05285 [Draconibacterium sp.]|nr:hypothetical protein [Draconibacterium sp.]